MEIILQSKLFFKKAVEILSQQPFLSLLAPLSKVNLGLKHSFPHPLAASFFFQNIDFFPKYRLYYFNSKTQHTDYQYNKKQAHYYVYKGSFEIKNTLQVSL